MAQRIEFQFVGDPSDLVDAFEQVTDAAKDTESATDDAAGSAETLNDRFEAASDKVGKAASFVAKYTAALTASVGAMVLLAVKTAEADRALGEFALRMGTDVETLSQLRFAASSLGLDFEELERGTRKLGQGLAEVAAGGTSETAEAMRALGLSGTDLIENLDRVADAFVDMEDGAEKTTLAMRLFGEETGPRMLEFLNQGSAGIDELRAKASELGATVRDEDVAAAREFQAAMGELKAAAGSLAAEFGRALLPSLVSIAETTSDVIGWYREFVGLARESTTDQEVLANRTAMWAEKLEEARHNLTTTTHAIHVMREAGAPVSDDLLAVVAQATEDLQTYGAMLYRAERRSAELTEQTREASAAVDDLGTSSEDTAARVVAGKDKEIAAIRAAVEAAIAAKVERERLTTEERAAFVAKIEEEKRLLVERDELDRQLAEERRSRVLDEASNVIAVANRVSSVLRDINKQLQAARREEIEKATTEIDRLEQRLADATTTREREVLQMRLRTARHREREAIRLGREEWQRGQALAVGTAIINTAAAVVQALGSTPPPYSYILGGISELAGQIQIAAIAAQPPPFHSGGLIRDEVLIRARSGEAVLSPQGVSSVGGPEVVAEINRGRGSDGAPVVIVQKLDHKVYNAQTTQALQQQGSALSTAIRAAQPRAIGRNNPNRRS